VILIKLTGSRREAQPAGVVLTHVKISNFTNIIAPKGRVPCTILTKFTEFMRVLSLHNYVKFGCFSSINDKPIKN